jgi:hypothetical protein
MNLTLLALDLGRVEKLHQKRQPCGVKNIQLAVEPVRMMHI